MPAPLHRLPQTGSAMALATRELIAYLQPMQPGDFIPYADLRALTGITDQKHLSRLLRTARRFLRAQYRLEFEPQVGQGLVCLTERGKVGYVAKNRREIHNRAETNIKRAKAIDPTPLTPDERQLYLADLSVNAAVALATHEKTVTELVTQRTPQPVLIDPRSYKDLFKGL